LDGLLYLVDEMLKQQRTDDIVPFFADLSG